MFEVGACVDLIFPEWTTWTLHPAPVTYQGFDNLSGVRSLHGASPSELIPTEVDLVNVG